VGNFDFVRAAWPDLAEEARLAERSTYADPRVALIYARRTLELTVNWLYKADSTLRLPYKDDLASMLFEPSFKRLVGSAIATKMDLIRRQGNFAVHRTTPMTSNDSGAVIRELFHVLVWVATRYALRVEDRPARGLEFDAASIPKPQPGVVAKTLAQVKALAEELAEKDAKLAEAERRNEALEAELAALQAEVAAAKAANATVPDTHDYSEAATRDLFIDILLREAGWDVTAPNVIEFPVTGMPNNSEGGKGFVDYVLWGDDGLPLGVVEAKRTKKDANVGQQQAKLYADALERQFGRRPVIFYTNGYEHWIWDDAFYPPRPVQGFYTRDELALLIQRRTTRKPLAAEPISETIVERYYQQRAVRRVAEAFEQHERRALLVMATGSGKTRTVIALADLLIRANWVKRVLFLADRIALVNQATNAFKQHLPDAAPVNLVTDKDSEGRVYVSTYPTIMNLIDKGEDDLRRFGPGYFDLIVVDEAHRSVYQKYGEIFNWFDALVVGLTATPKDEIDHNTYGLFNLEDGVPTDSYDLTDAITEGYLVPPVGRSVSTQFMRQGIRYDELSPEEREQWDLLDWEDGDPPDEVDAAAVNKWLFNADTVDKVLQELMTNGRKVAGGDKIGKTIVFARSNAHADFIVKRFDLNYPQYAGHFARVITYKTTYVQNLIDDFSITDKLPQIAVSVDMLDTGIDIPDVVNLVFFKPVYSKTKYWQMVGRGTRLRPDIYGPGENKADFVIFDVCQNIEYFNQELGAAAGPTVEPLGARLFKGRLQLLAGMDAMAVPDPELAGLREGVAARLHDQVAGMSLDNFIVRPHRREVERFAEPQRWTDLSGADYESAATLAGLPSAVDVLDQDEKAKRFDLLALRAQLSVLTGAPGFAAAKERIIAIAEELASQPTIPKIAAELVLIAAVTTEEWWEGVTVAMLEMVRIRLRGLVGLIDGSAQAILYSDFQDAASEAVIVELKDAATGVDRARFREKALAFLRDHENDAVLFKVRHGKQLTPVDLAELERIMVETAGLDGAQVAAAASEARGLGLFVRSLLGLDRGAAVEALSEFTAGTTFTGNQLAFAELVVDQLTQRGVIDPRLLYEAPFTGVAPTGPEAIFTAAQVKALVHSLETISATAAAS